MIIWTKTRIVKQQQNGVGMILNPDETYDIEKNDKYLKVIAHDINEL